MLDLEVKVFSDFGSLKESFGQAAPFPHVVVDNFLDLELARKLDQEFPSLDSDLWYKYKNAIEYKKHIIIGRHFPKQHISFLHI